MKTFARRMFGDAPAVGRHFLGSDLSPQLVVGVVEDGKYDSLTEDAFPSFPRPTLIGETAPEPRAG
jgi:hypothetical protein